MARAGWTPGGCVVRGNIVNDSSLVQNLLCDVVCGTLASVDALPLSGEPFSRVVYRGDTSSFFGIGILLVSDMLDFRYFGRYHSPLFCILPPFPPPFFPKGG